MSIYIEGMKIPTAGRILIILPSGRTLEVSADSTQNIFGEAQAVPVPPHGRLGDLDKQDVQIESLIERHLHGYTKSTWDFVCELRDILKRNITIIPAEKGESNGGE